MNAALAVNTEPAGKLLESLRGMGLRVFTTDEAVIKVSPRDRVTTEIRSQIQRLRDGLLVHLEIERKAAEQLERRVRAMGERWGYSPEDLQEALLEARGEPATWLTLCDADELSARHARQAGLPYPP